MSCTSLERTVEYVLCFACSLSRDWHTPLGESWAAVVRVQDKVEKFCEKGLS